MEHTIDENIARLVHLLESKYVSKGTDYRPVDLAQKSQYFTLDVISHLAFGRPFGFLENDRDQYDYIKITDSMMPFMAVVADLPIVTALLQSPLCRGLMPKSTDPLGFGAFIGYVSALFCFFSLLTPFQVSQRKLWQNASAPMP